MRWLVVALLGLAGTSGAKAASPAWTSPVELSRKGTQLTVAIDPSGTSHAGWVVPTGVVEDGVEGAIRVRTIGRDGSLIGTPVSVAVAARAPSIAAGADGAAVIVWIKRQPSGAHEIWGAVRIGGMWLPGTRIGAFVGSSELVVEVAMDDAGNAVAAWGNRLNRVLIGASPVGAATYRTGQEWEPITLSPDGHDPAVARSAAGNFLVAWHDGLVSARTWNPLTGWGEPESTGVGIGASPATLKPLIGDDGSAFILATQGQATAVLSSFGSVLASRIPGGVWSTIPAVPGTPLSMDVVDGPGGAVSVAVSAIKPGASTRSRRNIVAQVYDLASNDAWVLDREVVVAPVSGDASLAVGIANDSSGRSGVLVANLCPAHEFGVQSGTAYVRQDGVSSSGVQVFTPRLIGFSVRGDCHTRPQIAVAASGHAIVGLPSQRHVALLYPTRVRVTAVARPRNLSAGRHAFVYVHVTARVRVSVRLQRRAGRIWRTVRSTAVVGGPGLVRVPIVAPRPGRYRLLVAAHDSLIERTLSVHPAR